MDKVGESKARNEAYLTKFSRKNVIKERIPFSITEPIIFDVGAHTGESVHFFRELFPNSRIFSFEPDPESFAGLEALANPSTTCFNMALSDSTGQCVFYRNKIGHTNSLLPVNLESRDSIYLNKVRSGQEDLEPERFNKETMVSVQRLDEFCAGQGIERIDLLKIDVQGAEAMVLSGGGRFLEHVKVIILEISFFDYYTRKSSFYDVEKIIHPFGFSLFAITEISNNPMNGRTDWAEVVYAKDDKEQV